MHNSPTMERKLHAIKQNLRFSLALVSPHVGRGKGLAHVGRGEDSHRYMVCWFSLMFDGSTAGTPGMMVLSSSAPQRLRFFLAVRAGEEDGHSK